MRDRINVGIEGLNFKTVALSYKNKAAPAFNEYLNQSSVKQARWILISGLIAGIGFYAIDFIKPFDTGSLIRILKLSMLLYLLVTFIFTFTRYFLKHFQIVLVSASLVFGTGYLIIHVMNESITDFSVASGLAFIILVTYSCSRIRFINALIVGFILSITYFGLILNFTFTSLYPIYDNILFIILINIIGFVVAYYLESHFLLSYLRINKICEENRSVIRFNNTLAQRIKNRTKILGIVNNQLHRETDERIVLEKKLLGLGIQKNLPEISETSVLSFLAHKIKDPLSGLFGFSQLLNTKELTFERKAKYIQIIQDNSEMLIGYIDNLLDYAQLKAGGITPEKENFDLKLFLSRIFKRYNLKKTSLRRGSIELLLNIPSEANNFILHSDKKRIDQILSILLDNAFKFTRKGYVEFGFELEERSWVTFFVKDSGVGIPKKEQADLLNFDNDNLLKGVFNLFNYKEIVKLLGGNVWFESKYGQGTSFFFKIPVKS